jgi:hypothetical protein
MLRHCYLLDKERAMSESAASRWLEDQPETWHAVDRALHDCSVLLEYLGKLPEARLLAYFDDTKGQIVNAPLKNAVPPTPCYSLFLNELARIAKAFQTGQTPADPSPPAGRTEAGAASKCPPLDPVSFVQWSRDFLATVAAPATSESIQMTQQYAARRAQGGWPRRFARWLFSWCRQTPAPPPPDCPPLKVDRAAPYRGMMAARLAKWAWRFEFLTILAVGVTVLISIYALSGQLILSNERERVDAWSKVDAQLKDVEDKFYPPVTVPISDQTPMIVVRLCTSGGTAQPSPAPNSDSPRDGALTSVVYRGTPGRGADGKVYFSAQHEHLCDEQAKALLNLFVVSMHLQSWSSVVTQLVPVSPFFGVHHANIDAYPREGKGNLCAAVAPDAFKIGDGVEACRRILWNSINRSHHVAESILGSISQYILPVCYGFLGAMAAALRMLSRNTRAHLLSNIDRARLVQGAILGILSGGVIGLFSSYLGKPDATTSLGMSAVAFLAGYNVDGVCRFLDELSDRIFRPGDGAKPPQTG